MDNLTDDPNSASGKRIDYVKNLTYAEYNKALLIRDAEIERLRAALLKKSKCVALHMGGNHCVGKCLDPKDCSETPIPNEQ